MKKNYIVFYKDYIIHNFNFQYFSYMILFKNYNEF